MWLQLDKRELVRATLIIWSFWVYFSYQYSKNTDICCNGRFSHVKVAQRVPAWISSATCSGWLVGWSLTSLVSTNMAISETNLFWNRTKEDKYNTFYGPDVLPVTQPTVSKHWRKHKSTNGLTSFFTLIEGPLLPLRSHRRQYEKNVAKNRPTNFRSNSANMQNNKHATSWLMSRLSSQ